MSPFLLIAVFITTFILSQCDDSPAGLEDGSSQPMSNSGKRQHSIIRFGKRPSSGHNLLRFGKREGPQHRFLSMGKREYDGEENSFFPDFLKDDKSNKRAHTIMRFGKRTPPQGSHNFIRFGRGEGDEDFEDEEIKRATNGHSMMYFGKRGGHKIMSFGKRGMDIPWTFEDEDTDENQVPIYLTPEMNEKRYGNRYLPPGKKGMEESRARGSHAMIHFGKRSVSTGNSNQSDAVATRTKREAIDEEEEVEVPLYYPRPPAMWDEVSSYLEYGEPEKRDGPSKNVFLRFG